MFAMRSPISVQVSKNIFGIINKREVSKKSIGGLEKNSKINTRRGRLFDTQE